MLNVGPNVLSGSLNDIISCDNVTVYDKIVEGESESTDGANEEVEYVNFGKCGDVENYSCPTVCDQDYTPPAKSINEYITPGITYSRS